MLILSYRPFLLRKDIFYYFTFLFLLIIAGLIYNIGVDYKTYQYLFNLIRDSPNIDRLLEPMTYLFVNLSDFVGLGNQFIFFIYSFITLFGVFYFIYKLSPHKELSIFLFLTIGIFYFSTFNAIREWLAISFILIAIIKNIENKKKSSYFFLLLAFLSHYSSIILIIIFPFLFIKHKLKTIVFVFSLILIFSHVLLHIISLTPYGIYLKILIFSKTGNILLLSIYSAVLLFFPFYFKYFNKKIILSKKMLLLLNMNIFSFLIMILGYSISINFLTMMRVNMYFQIQLLILIPMFLYCIKDLKLRFIFLYIGICFSSVYYFYLIYIKGIAYSLAPYKFIFWR